MSTCSSDWATRKAAAVKKWRYHVTGNDHQEKKVSDYTYDTERQALEAGESYVDKQKPAGEGGWSVTTSWKSGF
jgi:hypothetical protein